MDYSNGYGMHGISYGGFEWGWILMIAVMALIVLGVILFVRYTARNQLEANKSNPLDVLKHRYAKGEITKKQFDEIKKDLK